MDALLLARIQFAANISFHILFPTISIAMGWLLLFFKLKHLRNPADDRWMALYRFWVKVFALTFALGVVSGITMSFQFGTNWPGYMGVVGNIAGPLLAYEVLTAFFMEATFLAIMLFGMNRVSERVHTTATALVCIGTTISAFWILALNSWMHTPAGFEMREGVAHALSWWDVIFNPSLPYRLTHMLLASGLTVSFFVAGISAYRLKRGSTAPESALGLRVGVTLAAVLIPLQILVGDLHGLNTLKHQPAKIAAIEAIWHTEQSAPLILFAWPNQETRSNDYQVSIPKLGSLILAHDLEGEIKGLNEFEGEHAPVAPVFFAFRIMVGVGLLMLALSWASVFLLRRGPLPHWLLRVLSASTFIGWAALLAGWYTTEMGRQPWLVQGVLKTADAVSKTAGSGMVLTSLIMYLVLYAVLIASYVSVVFYMGRRADEHGNPPPVEGVRP